MYKEIKEKGVERTQQFMVNLLLFSFFEFLGKNPGMSNEFGKPWKRREDPVTKCCWTPLKLRIIL